MITRCFSKIPKFQTCHFSIPFQFAQYIYFSTFSIFQIHKTDTDENKLREAFSAYGTVTDVFLPIERATQRPRGFGFVSFDSRASAEEAIAKMDQAQLDSRTIRVNESRPRGEGGDGRGPGGRGGFNPTGGADVKLYVGNLSFESTDETVKSSFEKYGAVSDCFLPTDRETGKPRGFAFVTMAASDAEKACVEMNGAEVDGRTLRVNEAQPKGGARGGGGGGGTLQNMWICLDVCSESFESW